MANHWPSPTGPAWDPRAPYRRTWRARSVPVAANDNRAPLNRRLRPVFGLILAATLLAGIAALVI